MDAIGEPLSALARGVPISVAYVHEGEAYVGAFEVFVVEGGLEWVSAVVMPADGFHGDGDRAARYVAYAGAAGVMLVLLFGAMLALFRRKRIRRRVRKRRTQNAIPVPGVAG